MSPLKLTLLVKLPSLLGLRKQGLMVRIWELARPRLRILLPSTHKPSGKYIKPQFLSVYIEISFMRSLQEDPGRTCLSMFGPGEHLVHGS